MYWYKTCPFCNQGRLFVFNNNKTDKLYLHCEECERGYNDIENIDKEHSFLTLSEDFDAVAATEKDINNAGWHSMVLNVATK